MTPEDIKDVEQTIAGLNKAIDKATAPKEVDAYLPEPRDDTPDAVKKKIQGAVLACLRSRHEVFRLFALDNHRCFEPNHAEALELVRRVLIHDPSVAVRREAVGALAFLRSYSWPEPSMLEALAKESDPRTRFAIAHEALQMSRVQGSANDDGTLARAVRLGLLELEDISDEDYRKALLDLADGEWDPRLLARIVKMSPDRRTEALLYARFMRNVGKDPAYRAAIIEVLKTSEDRYDRHRLIDDLAVVDAGKEAPFTAEEFAELWSWMATEDPAPANRTKAIKALREGGKAPIEKLLAALDKERSKTVKAELAGAILEASGIPEFERIELLIENGKLEANRKTIQAILDAFAAKGAAGLTAWIPAEPPWITKSQLALRQCKLADEDGLIVNAPIFDESAPEADRELAKELAELLASTVESSEADEAFHPTVLRVQKKGEAPKAVLQRALKIPRSVKLKVEKLETPFLDEYAETGFKPEQKKDPELDAKWLTVTQYYKIEGVRARKHAADRMRKALKGIVRVAVDFEDTGMVCYPVFRVGTTKSGNIVGVMNIRVDT